jgi:hypothetical protein
LGLEFVFFFQGRSQLALQAVGPDATPLKLVNSSQDKREWQVNVEIGGEIDVSIQKKNEFLLIIRSYTTQQRK